MYQQEDEQTAGEIGHVCKDETNNALFAQNTGAKLQSLVRLSHARTCTQQSPFYLSETREKEHRSRRATLFTDVCQLADSTPKLRVLSSGSCDLTDRERTDL